MATVGLIGYGEVGRILAEDLRARHVEVVAHDRKLPSPTMAEHAGTHGVQLLPDHAAVAAVADLVISAVTADQAVAVADAVAPALRPGTFVLDMNSASPGAKGRAAEVVNAAGGRYVEAAVMTSIPPYRSGVPILLGGPDAGAAAPLVAGMGFTGARVHDERLGIAAATKLARSIVIKGMEAIFVESLTTARHFGVEDAVLASLAETFPGIDWDAQASYFFQRAIEHGTRRSEEMREAARTATEAGLTPFAASAAADRQAWLGALAASGDLAPTEDWRASADRILARDHDTLED